VFEQWAFPYRKTVEIIDKPYWLDLQHRDTLLVQQGEAGEEKPVVLLRRGIPRRGMVSLSHLKRVTPSDPGCESFRRSVAAAFTKLIEETAWSWPDSGVDVMDSFEDFDSDYTPRPGWSVSLRKQEGRGRAVGVTLIKGGTDVFSRDKGQPMHTWLAYPIGTFRILSPLGLFYAEAYPEKTGVFLSRFDFDEERVVWRKQLTAGREPFLKSENHGAIVDQESGFLVVRGMERGLSYIEVLDPGTGFSFANRIAQVDR
jgi:hypothetical protein